MPARPDTAHGPPPPTTSHPPAPPAHNRPYYLDAPRPPPSYSTGARGTSPRPSSTWSRSFKNSLSRTTGRIRDALTGSGAVVARKVTGAVGKIGKKKGKAGREVDLEAEMQGGQGAVGQNGEHGQIGQDGQHGQHGQDGHHGQMGPGDGTLPVRASSRNEGASGRATVRAVPATVDRRA